MAKAKRYTAISLFSGIGGIDLAMSLAGFDILYQAEINPYAQRILRKHRQTYWPNARILADVRHITGRKPHTSEYTYVSSVDAIVGGFPCQDVSVAGRGAGIHKGTRSGLWYEFARLIGEIRPRIVLLENVPAITTNGGVAVAESLAALGYDAKWGIISAEDAGAPHVRQRWFCVAVPDTRSQRHIVQAAARQRSVHKGSYSQAVAKRNRSQRPTKRSFAVGNTSGKRLQAHLQRIAHPKPVTKMPYRASRISHAQIYQSRMGRSINGVSDGLDGCQLMAHAFPAYMNQPQHAHEPPTMLQKRPKNWAHRIEALGNAVVPQVVYPIAREMYSLLEQQRLKRNPVKGLN